MDFKGITHVIENPKGHAPGWNYSLVGSVPAALLDADYRTKPWATVDQIIEAAAKVPGAQLCVHPTCACRKLFTLEAGGVE